MEDERVTEGPVVAKKRVMSEERSDPADMQIPRQEGRQGGMIKTPITLQDLRRRLYVKAKAEKTWRFWGLYTHVCKMETLHQAYQMARKITGPQESMG